MPPLDSTPDPAPEPAPEVDPASPCIGVCVLDPASAQCRGCGRTGAEIQAWPWASAQERRLILQRIRGTADSSGRDPGPSTAPPRP